MKRSLLLGCGSRRERSVFPPNTEEEGWGELTTLDINSECHPDVWFDLSRPESRIPLDDNTFDEIHAYEVLEHIGAQGDYYTFFAQFSDYWRLLKPGGYFCATVPRHDSEWAWGDPSHRRVITPGTLVFLSQAEYQNQVGHTPMSDFRHIYHADFDVVGWGNMAESLAFILQAVKPSRWKP